MEVNDYQENYSTGWVKLYRSIQNKGWYKKPEYVLLWVHLLMKANHQGKEFWFNGNSVKLNPGQFVTGRKVLSVETGISESKIQRILKYFESEQQIEQQTSNVSRLISIVKYVPYQKSEQQIEQPVNNKRTTSEQPVNTNKNEKNKEELKEEFKGSSVFFETQMKRHGINDKEVFDIYIGSFIEMVDLKKHNIESLRNYFINWLRGQVDNSKQKKGNTKSGITL